MSYQGRPHRTWLVVLVLGIPLAALTVVLPAPAAQIGFLLIQFGTLAVTGHAVLGGRLAEASRTIVTGWMLVVTGRAVWVGAAMYWNAIEIRAGAPPYPSWVGVAFLVQYPLFVAGLLRVAQGGRRAGRERDLTRRAPAAGRVGPMLDVALITAVGAIAAWAFVIDPYVRIPGVSGVETATAFAYVVLDLLVVAAFLRVVAFGDRPSPARLLLICGAAALVGGDVLYLTQVIGSGHTVFLTGSGPDLLWLVWAIAVAAAALHPSAMRQTEPDRRVRDEPVLSRPRLVIFAVLALLVPAAPLLVPGAPAAAIVPAVLGAAVVLLLVIRLSMLAVLVGRESADLAQAHAQREALRDELRHRAAHDPLTGLASRAALMSRLGSTAPTADEVLLLIDLDAFADVNDEHGHTVGDQLLVEAAGRLRATLSRARLLARPGGDEFAALYPAAEGEEAAGRALAALRPAYRLGGRDLHVTASAGLVAVGAGGDAAAALRDADLALYAAKAAGRDRAVTFHPELRDDLIRRSELAEGLHRALERGELELVYQPVVDMISGRMVAAEALLRWHRADGEQVSPARFIPIAEQSGRIVPIGWWTLTQACARVGAWYERYGVAVTVNVSAHQLREPDFANRVIAILREAGVPGEAVILELTESALITDAPAAESALQRLRERGVRVAVDDFGTGYSSLSYLMALPVDILKLDRAFTAPREGLNSRQYAITGAVLQLAASLELTTIAEGVETANQARVLRSLGCPLAQGFLYSPGVPPVALEALLARWNPPIHASAGAT